MTTRRFAVALWTLAITGSLIWWATSYRYSAGFVWSARNPTSSSPGTRGGNRSDRGIAFLSGVGKGIFYLSWDSAFTRRGSIFEPVIPHEYPHPWLGAQGENGRLWISFPLGLVALVLGGFSWLHLRKTRPSRFPGRPDGGKE